MFTGCNKRIDSTTFRMRMEKNNFNITNTISQYDKELVESALIAINKSSNYQIEFLDFKSDDACKNSFIINRDVFKKNKKDKDKETSVSKNDYSKYTLTTSDTFYLVSRFEDSLVYLKVDGSFKADAEKIIKELGF